MSSAQAVQLVNCVTSQELGDAVRLRNRLFKARSGLEFDCAAERVRDSYSRVFMLTVGGVGVATSRVAPYPSLGSGLWEFGAQFPTDGVDSEVGRVAAERSAAGVRHSLLMMALGSAWMLESTEHRVYASYVAPSLVRLYASIGAASTGHTFEVPGRAAPYQIVQGRYADCARRGGEQLGLTARQMLRSLIRWDQPDGRTAA